MRNGHARVAFLTALLSIGLVGSAGPVAAQADPSRDEIVGCPGTADECVLAFVTGLEPPIVNAVRQLRLSGNDAAAAEFASERRATLGGKRDAIQDQIDEVLIAEADELALDATQTNASSTVPTEADPDPVSVTPFFYHYYTKWDYAYCTVFGCGEKVGSVVVAYESNIWNFPDVQINAYFNATGYPKIRIVELDCTTYLEAGWPNLIDLPIYEWPVCEELVRSTYSTYYDTRSTNWTHPEPEPLDQFHTEFYVQFKVKGDTSDSTLTMLLNTNTYAVPYPDSYPEVKPRFVLPANVGPVGSGAQNLCPGSTTGRGMAWVSLDGDYVTVHDDCDDGMGVEGRVTMTVNGVVQTYSCWNRNGSGSVVECDFDWTEGFVGFKTLAFYSNDGEMGTLAHWRDG